MGWQHLAWQSRSGCALLGDSWDVGIHDSPPNQGLRSHRKKYLYHSDYWVPVALSVVSFQKRPGIPGLTGCNVGSPFYPLLCSNFRETRLLLGLHFGAFDTLLD